MKNIISIMLLLGCMNIYGQYSYRHGGNHIDLTVNSKKVGIYFVQTAGETRSASLEQMQAKKLSMCHKITNNRYLVKSDLRSSIANSDEYTSEIYSSPTTEEIIILPRISLCVRKGRTLDRYLRRLKDKVVVEKQNGCHYILRCNVNTSKDVLQILGLLVLDPSVIIEWCEPEMYSNIKMSNILYPQQYYLKNIGQNEGTKGIDINVEPAWTITNGSKDVTVAVIDMGVEDHIDLDDRVLDGYTIGNPMGKGRPQRVNTLKPRAHGMLCTGIIAASNNNIGIRGIASNVKILPVNVAPNYSTPYNEDGFGTNVEVADAINWAWKRADILSCSWGGGEVSKTIIQAIDSARIYGRKGLGCPVIFSSGNEVLGQMDVAFPGNIDGVITVGAIDNKGKIQSYSRRGREMDLVAPSGRVVTTTLNNGYHYYFDGTSASCPQVAGVVALMLSVNPSLGERQITEILRNTARDLGITGFDETYGYGLVDATKAVQRSFGFLTGPSLICNQGTYFMMYLPEGSVVHWQASNDKVRLVSGQGTSSAVFARNAEQNGEVTISVYVDDVEVASQKVWVGVPVIRIQEENSIHERRNIRYYLCLNSVGTMSNSFWIEADGLDDQETWEYQKISQFTLHTTGNTVFFHGYNELGVMFRARVRNACGWSEWHMYHFPVLVCEGERPTPRRVPPVYDRDDKSIYVLQPIGIREDKASATTTMRSVRSVSTTTDMGYEVQIWDKNNKLVRSVKSSSAYLRIPFADYPKGLYVVRIIHNGEATNHKIWVP